MLRLLSALLLLGSPILAGETLVAVSAGDALLTYAIDPAKAGLEERSRTTFEKTVGVHTFRPDLGLLYLQANRGAVSSIFTLHLRAGKPNLLADAPIQMRPGYLAVHPSGGFLAGSNYPEGKVSIWRLDDEGLYQGDLVRSFDLEKRAHCVCFSEDGRFLFVPATGPNKIFQLRLHPETGEPFPNQPSSAPASDDPKVARQPRHLILHPGGRFAYSTMERERPGVGVWAFDPERGLLEFRSSLVSVKEGDETGMSTADLHLHPNGRFLYVSNRDKEGKGRPSTRDSVALFSVSEDGADLAFVERFSCARIPRSFALTPDGAFLVVGGQGDSMLGLHRVDPETGRLSKSASVELPGPARWVSSFEAP